MKVHPCPRPHSQETLAADGSVLCVACIRQLARNLRTLPVLHQESLHHVSPTPRRTNPTKVSGSRSRDYLNISVLDTRHHILAVLESWSGTVVEKLGSAAPDRSVLQMGRFLLAHLEWITAQDPAADFADEIDGIVAELRRTIDPDPGELQTFIRQCVVDDCAGTITASAQRAGSGGSIECSSGHGWEMREWLSLRQLIERRRESVSV
ncbi:hypothetical protein ACFWUZ_33825 [Streptomyces sp. NPDC058646]|uniref:hypothetical protein n=1 Tax=Streptomyces sp. NPDC058646 TaxID=3346574 RepID=UPI00364CC3E2